MIRDLRPVAFKQLLAISKVRMWSLNSLLDCLIDRDRESNNQAEIPSNCLFLTQLFAPLQSARFLEDEQIVLSSRGLEIVVDESSFLESLPEELVSALPWLRAGIESLNNEALRSILNSFCRYVGRSLRLLCQPSVIENSDYVIITPAHIAMLLLQRVAAAIHLYPEELASHLEYANALTVLYKYFARYLIDSLRAKSDAPQVRILLRTIADATGTTFSYVLFKTLYGLYESDDYDSVLRSVLETYASFVRHCCYDRQSTEYVVKVLQKLNNADPRILEHILADHLRGLIEEPNLVRYVSQKLSVRSQELGYVIRMLKLLSMLSPALRMHRAKH